MEGRNRDADVENGPVLVFKPRFLEFTLVTTKFKGQPNWTEVMLKHLELVKLLFSDE